MLIMECDKELDSLISQAFLKVEKDLPLPSNSLVDGMSLPKIEREVKLKKIEVHVDQNFIALRVPEKHIRPSKELVLHKRVAEQEETISLLINVLDLLLEQYY